MFHEDVEQLVAAVDEKRPQLPQSAGVVRVEPDRTLEVAQVRKAERELGTVKAVAERAGVQRLTVYRHFPREDDLFAACVTQGWEWFPPPDVRAWARLADPEERLRHALTELYRYYERAGDAFVVLLRDFPSVPALARLNEPYFAYWNEMRDVLAPGWGRRGRRRELLLAALDHVLDVRTWHWLVRLRGVPPRDAVELLVRFVAAT